MILADLLNDARKLPDEGASLPVLLATRTVNTELLPAGKVQTRDVGVLQIDESAEEIDILPVCFLDSQKPCLIISDVLHQLSDRPELGDFALSAIDRLKDLSDGGTVISTLPVIGTYIPPDGSEIWLLQYPEEQWPDEWFHA